MVWYSALSRHAVEGMVRKVTATMTCLLAAGFFSLSLSLLLCYLKSLVGGRGWDGMGWDGEGIKNLGTWALYVDYLRYDLICLA